MGTERQTVTAEIGTAYRKNGSSSQGMAERPGEFRLVQGGFFWNVWCRPELGIPHRNRKKLQRSCRFTPRRFAKWDDALNRNACYVLTAIRGAVITYQFTTEGEKKLTAAGIACGQQFHRALLLDLYRTGDAFTHGSGVDDPLASQMEMDFANDPDPETAFPACDVFKSVNDLHLTLTGSAIDLVAQLQCAACRAIPAARPDTSIPVALLLRYQNVGTTQTGYDKSDTRPVISHVAQAMLAKFGAVIKNRSGPVRLVRA